MANPLFLYDVLFTHTGALLTAGILGILLGFWWQRRQRIAALKWTRLQ